MAHGILVLNVQDGRLPFGAPHKYRVGIPRGHSFLNRKLHGITHGRLVCVSQAKYMWQRASCRTKRLGKGLKKVKTCQETRQNYEKGENKRGCRKK